MRKIFLANDSNQSLGGGWTFRRNFRAGLEKIANCSWELTDRWEECDVFLIPSATMVNRETVGAAKALGKKIVLRVDNAPRNSRNRNTGISRLRDFAQMADAVVFQSQWAARYLQPFLEPSLKRNPWIIYNGVDTKIFQPDGLRYDFHGKPVYLYSRFNRDETKQWEWAWWRYQMIQRENPEAFLVIVGQFSPEQIEYNFDFFMGEKFQYMGIIEDPYEMAKIYKGCNRLLATYRNDCFSNTYQEAMACGVELFEPDMSGGTPELLKAGVRDCKEMVAEYLTIFEFNKL